MTERGLFTRERLTKTIAKGALVTGLGFLAACGSSTRHDSIPKTDTTVTVPANDGQPEITYTYHANGTRTTHIAGLVDVLDYCDGKDLVSRNLLYYNISTPETRSADHPACADGRLDPSDFQIDK